MRIDKLFVYRRSISRYDISDQLRISASIFAKGARRRADTIGPQERRFDFTQFHPQAAQLDLPIRASDELDVAFAVEAAQIAAAVDPQPMAVRDKPGAGLVGKAQISAGDSGAADANLSRFAR